VSVAAPKKTVRYAVVGAGWISQAAFLPGLASTGNSEVTAVVTGDSRKAVELREHYGFSKACGYDGFADLVTSGDIDAIYLATPNDEHTKYAVPALEAGIHVLCEKPMAASVADCEAMIAAAKGSGAKLMIAYRLHFEAGTLAALGVARSKALGEARFFSSVFAQRVSPKNHRASMGYWAGPVPDMGTYQINAARNLFGTEPISVTAVGVRNPDAGLGDFDDTVSVTLTFPGNEIAQFTCSYAALAVDQYRLIGKNGSLDVEPAFDFRKAQKYRLQIGQGEPQTRAFPIVGQFGGQTQYFSQCVIDGRDPQPSGEEGLADVRVLAAIERALGGGGPQRLEPFERSGKPEASEIRTLPPVEEPPLVAAYDPSAG